MATKNDRLLRIGEVKKLTGLSGASLWRWERDGRFPKRLKLGNWSVAWRESEIQAWIASLNPKGSESAPASPAGGE